MFGPEDGFRIAAAISRFDGDAESIEDEEIGVLRFFIKSWTGPLDEIVFTELPTRQCTETDFQEHFFPLHPSMIQFVHWTKKMKCTDAPYQLWGDYDSDKTSNLQVVFDKCDPTKRTCKTEA